MQSALLSAIQELRGVSAEEKMTVVISMIMRENAYKDAIMLKITSTAEVHAHNYNGSQYI